MKIRRWVAISLATTLLLVVALAASAYSYTVRYGDTLSELAWKNNTTVTAIANANGIANPDLIYAGQQLEIPAETAPIVLPAPSVHTVTTYPASVPSYGVIRGGGDACTRFNFEAGRDRLTGSRQAGLYVMRETTAGDLVSWYALAGQKDSGWFDGIAISYESVHVTVTFYPADGSRPVDMQIVNHAPDRTTGWLSRDMCHAMEIQYP